MTKLIQNLKNKLIVILKKKIKIKNIFKSTF